MSRNSPVKGSVFGRRADDTSAETKRLARAGNSSKQEALRDTERLERIGEFGAEARQLEELRLNGTRLVIVLPQVIDSSNARILRRRVLACLPHCQSMELDADRLECLGDVGCAYLWQILNVARRSGVEVVLLHVSQRVHEALNRAYATDSARLVASGDGLDAAGPIEECEGELRIAGKTLRLRDGSVNTEGVRPVGSQREAQKAGSWTDRFTLKLFQRRKSA